jgi:hypothetical protein
MLALNSIGLTSVRTILFIFVSNRVIKQLPEQTIVQLFRPKRSCIVAFTNRIFISCELSIY